MSAETPRRTRTQQPVTSLGPAVITPQQVNDRSIIDSVAGFINEVVPAAYSTPTEIKDQLQWVHFEYLDKNHFVLEGDENGIAVPLIVVLGYGSGVQVWAVPINGDATEVLSWRHGSVRVLRILPNPQCSNFNEKIDLFSDKRPLMVLCDTATPGPQYFSLSFISLKTGDQVKNIKFKNPVLDVQANKRSVVVTFSERIAIFDAHTLEDRLTVTTCFLSPGVYPNPIALGTRWLAYAEKKLIPARRSGGGNEGEGVQSYTATVLHAAKSLGKGLRELGETVASSLAGSSVASVPHVPVNVSSDLVQPGVVTILDLQNAESSGSERGLPVESVVAHFTAHSEAIVCLQFDPSGMLLLTADKRGHDFHLFRIQPHPGGPSLAAVHHLYTLHRGDTSARVQDMCFSPDSRWVAVSTLRGTTHVFPITPYGGSVGMRTHATPHVVNRMSRFQRSAGLPVEGGRSNSPVSQYEVPGIQSGIPYRNPRLPPYPHSTVVHPLAQLRQTLNLSIAGTGSLTPRTGANTRSRLGSLSEDTSHAPLRVAACFAAPRAWLDAGNQPLAPRDAAVAHKQRRPVESLFVISSHGTLIQYDLEPRHASNVPKERVCDDTAIELKVNAKAQWNLQRQSNSCDIQAPLQPENILLTAICAGSGGTTITSSSNNTSGGSETDNKYVSRSNKERYNAVNDDRWLSQVEIVTHAGPHRRLWMGPQFTFKVYNGNNSLPISVMENEAIDVSIGSGSPMRPARSKPLNMPDDGVPVLIESGSASSFEQSPRLLDREIPGNCGESQLKEDLADAMLESPGRVKDNGGRCVLVSVKQQQPQQSQQSAHHTIVTKVVNPLGTVVTLPPSDQQSGNGSGSSTTDGLETGSIGDCDDDEIHENCDESLFRPVIACSIPKPQPRLSPSPSPPPPPPTTTTTIVSLSNKKSRSSSVAAATTTTVTKIKQTNSDKELETKSSSCFQGLEPNEIVFNEDNKEIINNNNKSLSSITNLITTTTTSSSLSPSITTTATVTTSNSTSTTNKKSTRKTKAKLGVRVNNPIVIEKPPIDDEIEPIIIENPRSISPKIIERKKSPLKHIIVREPSPEYFQQSEIDFMPPPPPLAAEKPELEPEPEPEIEPEPEFNSESLIPSLPPLPPPPPPEEMWSSVDGGDMSSFLNKIIDNDDENDDDMSALLLSTVEKDSSENSSSNNNNNNNTNNNTDSTTESDDSNKITLPSPMLVTAPQTSSSSQDVDADDDSAATATANNLLSLPASNALPTAQKTAKKKPKKKRK